ncbi:MAG: DNA-binding response regulator [Nitrosomonadales bacterium]|nr:MAG: DNA-binding response regulator [Nitrosomonadales bacterium]
MKPDPTVFIVDDDAGMRSALYRLVRSAGMRAESFASALEFLAVYHSGCPGCLLLDVQMPRMGGLELQRRLKLERIDIPIIFLTAYGNVPAAVGAMKLGALDFLEKPFDNEELLDRLRQAIQMDAAARLKRRRHSQISQRLAQLTPREHEIMDMLVAGKPNKAIAGLLGLSVRTVETHRANIMDKMRAGSLSELVRMDLDFKAAKHDNQVPLYLYPYLY